MSCCNTSSSRKTETSAQPGWLSGSRRLWLLAVVAIVGGLVLGWEQLALLGIAPMLVSLLPCLLMCGLGLCMMKCKDKKARPDGQSTNVDAPASVEGARSVSKETA